MNARLGLVSYDTTMLAWALDPAGAIVGGATEAEIELMLPVALAEHATWLRAHGEDIADYDGWEFVERVDARDHTLTGGEFCFDAERESVSDAELEMLIRRMGYARADLMASVAGLPDVILDWEPPVTSQKAVDAWAPEARTIRGVVEHVLQLEVYYRDGLRDGPSKGIFERVGNPDAERARTVGLLRSFADEDRARVWHPTRPGRPHPEDWTVRKLARRIISHERAHAAEIMQRRTWILLGVPSFG